MEEEKLELELAMKESRLGDYINDDECLDSPQALDVEVLGQAQLEEDNKNLKSLQVVPLKGTEYIPFKGSEEAVGFDVRSTVEVKIPAGERRLVPLGIACRCPEGSYIRIAPRSGLSVKKSLDVGAGVVDRDYTGEV